MKKELKRKKGETLHDWLDRLQKYYGLSDEMREVLREVSVSSYIHGTNDAQRVLRR